MVHIVHYRVSIVIYHAHVHIVTYYHDTNIRTAMQRT